MKRLIFVLALLAGAATAATKWTDPLKAAFPAVQNQAWPSELAGTYFRLPPRAENLVRKPVWDQARQSAGLALRFVTDAPDITVRYTLEGMRAMQHMQATGVSGVDMYRINPDGSKDYCWGRIAMGDTVRFSYRDLPASASGKTEYLLDLPLYNTVKWLEIGVPDSCSFTLLPRDGRKSIVVYGTSIAQGACASRPGMAWANIVGRKLDIPVVNLGFSGNGRLEPEVIDFINEIDAELYIFDCLPNLDNKSEEEARQLVVDAVERIRSKSSTPILLVEHAGYGSAPTNEALLDTYTRLNRGQRKAYTELEAKGTPNLHYLTRAELDLPADSWVDYVHPSDLGQQAQAQAVIKAVCRILDISRD